MNATVELIEDFYHKVWNAGDKATAYRILAPDLQFRGSTGRAMHGIEDFLGYVQLIKRALSEYECVIEELVTEGDRCFAKMNFAGRHTGVFFGKAPTGKRIAWVGAALFEIEELRIKRIWVLGDVDHIKVELGLAEKLSP